MLVLSCHAAVQSVVRSPQAVSQCVPVAGSLACTPVRTVASVEPTQWSNLPSLVVPPQAPVPAMSPSVRLPRPFTLWVLLSDWRFDGNGASAGVSTAVGLHVTVDCAALAPGMQVPAGGVRLQTGGSIMFSRANPTPAAAVPLTRQTLAFGSPTDIWNSSVPVVFDLNASWASPSFAVAVCMRSLNGSNVGSLFAVTAELFFVNPTTENPLVWAIVGGVLGGLALAAIVAVVVVWAVRKKPQMAQMSQPLLRDSQESGEPAPAMTDMSAWGVREESVIGPPGGNNESTSMRLSIRDLNE